MASIQSAFLYRDKISEMNNLEKLLILAHGARGFNPWSFGPVALSLEWYSVSWKEHTGWGAKVAPHDGSWRAGR